MLPVYPSLYMEIYSRGAFFPSFRGERPPPSSAVSPFATPRYGNCESVSQKEKLGRARPRKQRRSLDFFFFFIEHAAFDNSSFASMSRTLVYTFPSLSLYFFALDSAEKPNETAGTALINGPSMIYDECLELYVRSSYRRNIRERRSFRRRKPINHVPLNPFNICENARDQVCAKCALSVRQVCQSKDHIHVTTAVKRLCETLRKLEYIPDTLNIIDANSGDLPSNLGV